RRVSGSTFLAHVECAVSQSGSVEKRHTKVLVRLPYIDFVLRYILWLKYLMGLSLGWARKISYLIVPRYNAGGR
ncbi:MAG TPA: hypothetical protein VFK30_07750, partial [Anaerolineae bacterium]|nr:hypothetical protein [Anaerolineae bacterium]